MKQGLIKQLIPVLAALPGSHSVSDPGVCRITGARSSCKAAAHEANVLQRLCGHG